MIHVHNGNKTLRGVRKIPLIRPQNAGRWWKGIRHGTLVDAILDESEARGWAIGDSKFSVSKDGTDMAAAFDIAIPKLKSPDGLLFALGILANNKRERALRMYAGATISICRNGFVSGEILLNKKHTTQFNLEDGIEEALDEYVTSVRKIPKIVRNLRNYKLTASDYEHIMIEAGRNKLMPWSRLGDVDREYCNPRFRSVGKGTSWSLLNAFTYVVKRNPTRKQMDQINKFRRMLPINVTV